MIHHLHHIVNQRPITRPFIVISSILNPSERDVLLYKIVDHSAYKIITAGEVNVFYCRDQESRDALWTILSDMDVSAYEICTKHNRGVTPDVASRE